MAANDKKTTVISVAYNSTDVLRQMLASLPEAIACVIVDNSPRQDAALVELAAQTGTYLITNPVNNGFGAACNQGADWAQSEFLFFLNPDATIDSDTVNELQKAAQNHPGASAFLPRVARKGGKPDFKRRSILAPKSVKMGREWPRDGAEVPVASGAALFVRRSAFERIGGFDPRIFLYHEDDDLTLRLIRDVGPIVFVASANVTHIGGQSTERTAATARLKAWHMGRSGVYATQKHGQTFAFGKALFRAALQIVSPLVWFSPRKRAKQIGLLKGVLSARLDGGAGFKEVQ